MLNLRDIKLCRWFLTSTNLAKPYADLQSLWRTPNFRWITKSMIYHVTNLKHYVRLETQRNFSVHQQQRKKKNSINAWFAHKKKILWWPFATNPFMDQFRNARRHIGKYRIVAMSGDVRMRDRHHRVPDVVPVVSWLLFRLHCCSYISSGLCSDGVATSISYLRYVQTVLPLGHHDRGMLMKN